MDPFYFGPPADQQLGAAVAVDEDDYLTSLGLVLSPAPALLPVAEEALPAGGAFEAYQQRRVPALLQYNNSMTMTMSRPRLYSGRGQNLHRRMFSYLTRIAHGAAAASTEVPPAFHPAPADETTTSTAAGVVGSPHAPPTPSSRFRHIMRERLRRERLSQGFADLHALLPPGASSKGGKNDIVGAAAGYISELAARKEWLSARNEVLLQRAAAATTTRWRGGGGGGTSVGRGSMVVKVRAESQDDHSTAVDAFERVLQRLKAMEELQVTAIRSRFSAGGMWMNVGVQGQVSTREVDKAITNALMELEGNYPRSSKPSFSCQVETVQMG